MSEIAKRCQLSRKVVTTSLHRLAELKISRKISRQKWELILTANDNPGLVVLSDKGYPAYFKWYPLKNLKTQVAVCYWRCVDLAKNHHVKNVISRFEALGMSRVTARDYRSQLIKAGLLEAISEKDRLYRVVQQEPEPMTIQEAAKPLPPKPVAPTKPVAPKPVAPAKAPEPLVEEPFPEILH